MPTSRRTPDVIALELLNCIDEKQGTASKWDLIKILGNEAQFRQWMDNFLIKDRFIEERQGSRRYYYRKTENGDLLHELLRNGKIIRAFLRVSGKRLRSTR
jgi:predicted transcriptional regulator